MNQQREWLCEIRVKDWVADLKEGHPRVHTYVEVVASNQFSARQLGYNEFVRLTKFAPIPRRRFEATGLGYVDFCCPDAVEI